MMIEYVFNENDGLQLRQQGLSPTVYLDHWALRMFSEDRALSSRFEFAIKRCNGTLAMSWINLSEFAKVTVKSQACSAESFIESIFPRLFFLECNPFVVIDREDLLLAGGEPTAPHADLELLKAFAESKSASVRLFTANGLFQVMNGKQLSKGLDDLADLIIDRVTTLRGKLDSNLVFQSAVRQQPKSMCRQGVTRVVLRELTRALLMNTAMKLTRNHAVDLLHAVVPVAYCDLVLLDKHWEAQVNQSRMRLDDAGISIPVAKVFSARRKGVERFLCELESD